MTGADAERKKEKKKKSSKFAHTSPKIPSKTGSARPEEGCVLYVGLPVVVVSI